MITAPVAGEVGPLQWASDPAFSLLGAGVVIRPAPTDNLVDVHAPVSGVVMAAHPHALAIQHDAGAVLLHLGVDTVRLPEVFTSLAAKGSQVHQGQLVIRWDARATARRGFSTDVVVVALGATELMGAVTGPVEQDGLLWRESRP